MAARCQALCTMWAPHPPTHPPNHPPTTTHPPPQRTTLGDPNEEITQKHLAGTSLNSARPRLLLKPQQQDLQAEHLQTDQCSNVSCKGPRDR